MWMILCRGRKPKKQALLEALAEEDTQILALAYAHAKYLMMYGVDIEKALYTATENAEVLTKAYQKGYYDAMNKISQEVKPLINGDWQYGNESLTISYSDRTTEIDKG